MITPSAACIAVSPPVGVVMLKVYNCIADAHDLRLVGLAAFICVLASFAAINLLRHARKSSGHLRLVWLAVSAVSTGFGIWATHFVAMLAFKPGIPSGYNIALTTAVADRGHPADRRRTCRLVDSELAPRTVARRRDRRRRHRRDALHRHGGVRYRRHRSLGSGAGRGLDRDRRRLGAVALPVGLHGNDEKWKVGGALLLTLAICSHHFTAMAAVSIIPDPTIEVPLRAAGRLAGSWRWRWRASRLSVWRSPAIVLDIRDGRRSELEVDRMRDLANASVEGLLVCDGDKIVSVNTSFAVLAGSARCQSRRRRARKLFSGQAARARLLAGSNQTVETNLRHRDGSMTPVELLLRPIVFCRTAAPCRRGARPAGAQASRAAYPLSRPPRRADRAAQPQLLQRAARSGDRAALTGGESLAVLCLDLDRFKEVNDLFGHAAGDACCRPSPRASPRCSTSDQMMARLGGDEFAILMPRVRDPAAAGRLAETHPGSAARAEQRHAGTDSISTSIGIAICPDDAHGPRSPAQPCRHRALPRQDRGPRHLPLLRGQHGRAVRDRRLLEHDLRHAVAATNCGSSTSRRRTSQTGAITGFEALLRWRHPARGEISPAVFIPIAEESGAILRDRRLGAAERLPRSRELDAAADGRRQRLGGAAPQPALRAAGARDPARDRPAADAAGDRDHRDRADPRSDRALHDAAPAQGARRPHRHGRFRHRLFVAVEPARLPVRQDQDRRLVHQVGQHQRARPPRSCAPCSASAAASACRCWRKASRRTTSCIPARRILRRGAGLPARPPGRSTVSAISPTPRFLPTTNKRGNSLCLAQKAPENTSQAPSREAVTGSHHSRPQVKVWVFAIEIRVTTTAFIKPPR